MSKNKIEQGMRKNAKNWSKPSVTEIAPVRKTRGGTGNTRPTENFFYTNS